jgi:hypothetical protein
LLTVCPLPGHVDSAFFGAQEVEFYDDLRQAHDQTVADDYFQAMQRVEQRLDILPMQEKKDEVVKVQVMQIIEKLETPELRFEERALLVHQLREVFGRFEEQVTIGVGSIPIKVQAAAQSP